MASDAEYRCFVGGLAWATDDRGLGDAFRSFGEVIESKVPNHTSLCPLSDLYFAHVCFLAQICTWLEYIFIKSMFGICCGISEVYVLLRIRFAKI